MEKKLENLRKKVRYVFGSQVECANYLSITTVSLSNKLNGKAMFSKAEALALEAKHIRVPKECVKK